MCGGICGPAGESSGYSYTRTAPRKITQKKVPYKNHSGTVLAEYEGQRMFVQMYKCKRGDYTVSWSSVLSSGAATYRNNRYAVSEYNKHVPKDRKI